MLKTFKFKGDESNFFWVSDLHNCHGKEFLFGRRGYSSIEEHDRALIKNWNSVCDSNSTVFNLGDIQFHDGDGSKFLELNRSLNFKEHYIGQGNHNSGYRTVYVRELKEQFPNSIDSFNNILFEVYPLIKILDGYKKIIFMPEYFEVYINSQFVVNCHYPIYSFNQQSKGGFQISGHVHGNCALTHPNTGKGNRLDVSIENFKRPISLPEIRKILSNRTDLDIVDHHGL